MPGRLRYRSRAAIFPGNACALNKRCRRPMIATIRFAPAAQDRGLFVKLLPANNIFMD